MLMGRLCTSTQRRLEAGDRTWWSSGALTFFAMFLLRYMSRFCKHPRLLCLPHAHRALPPPITSAANRMLHRGWTGDANIPTHNRFQFNNIMIHSPQHTFGLSGGRISCMNHVQTTDG